VKETALRLRSIHMHRLLLLLSVALLCSACAETPLQHPGTSSVSATESEQSLRLISAIYGWGPDFVDITDKVGRALDGSTHAFVMSNEWLGYDPSPGHDKVLVVVWEVGERRYVFPVREGETLDRSMLLAGGQYIPAQSEHPPRLSGPDGSIVLISATYGAWRSFVDASVKVADTLDKQISFEVRPEWYGTDLMPGWGKSLVIIYEFRGNRCTYVATPREKVSYERLVAEAKEEALAR